MSRIFVLSLLVLWTIGCTDTQQTSGEKDKDQAVSELTAAEMEQYLTQGKKTAQATFAVLSGQLMASIKEGGVPQAIDYCNVAAYPLTDSMSQAMHASIRRTAMRYRNPDNAPDEAERRILEQYQAQVEAGGSPKPIVEPSGSDSVAFYAPILLLEACQKCHGTVGEEVNPAHYDLISQHYPSDKAVNFSEGDLRGIWSIRFERQ